VGRGPVLSGSQAFAKANKKYYYFILLNFFFSSCDFILKDFFLCSGMFSAACARLDQTIRYGGGTLGFQDN